MSPRPVVPRGADALVREQIQRWQLREERGGSDLSRGSPCIAISRLHGSGGAEVGRRVAERLGFGFFDREIVNHIAREEGVQRWLVEDVDEHVRTAIDRWVLDAFRGRRFSESDYLRGVVRAVATLAERGAAVVLGRGSPFLLSSDRALRVLVVAPKATRVERFAKEHGCTSEEAAERLVRKDAERREFLARSFDVAPDDPTLYDLVVNSATLGAESAGDLIVEAFRLRFPRSR
jgi:cytidylate kinase